MRWCRRVQASPCRATTPLLRCSEGWVQRAPMEASSLTPAGTRVGILGRRSPLLKLAGDARPVALIRAGNPRLRRPLRALPLAAARLLPPHAALRRGRRGRAAGGLRQGARGDDRRRAPDQRAPVALPDRAQPLPQPPPPAGPRGPGLDGRDDGRGRRHHRRQGAGARGSALWSRTSRVCPRPSAPRCCCARSRPSPTRRSP